MAGYKTDIRKIDVVLNGAFGSYSFKNWGENGVSITVEALDEDLYKEKLGANGDMLLGKSYKPNNKLIRMQVLPKSDDYVWLQKQIALEESGAQGVFVCTVKDNTLGESFTSTSCVFKNAPKVEFGGEIAGDIEFTILMPSAVHLVD